MNRALKFFVLPLLIGATMIVALYSPTLSAPLVFDDTLFDSPTFFASYKDFLPLKVRALSYGSFAWLSDASTVASALQRSINVALHIACVALLGVLFMKLSGFVDVPESRKLVTDRLDPRLAFALCVFAFNPVAVYAVAYLVQRSILMCTMFSLLCLILTTSASQAHGRPRLWILAALAYVAAMLSKEYAVALPAICALILIFVRRPSRAALVGIAIAALAVGGGIAAVLFSYYGRIIGTAFDENSALFLKQLGNLAPGVKDDAWALSAFNQTFLFFEYGWRWFFPNVNAMSIDMRPPFPIGFGEAKYWMSALGYVGVLIGSIYFLLMFRDWRALFGLSLAIPSILFATEFSTVWIQDPFVLYRSYLWAMGVPGVILALSLRYSTPSKRWWGAAALVSAVFAALAFNRVETFQSKYAVWNDAVAKLPSTLTVGQSRVFNNRGLASLSAGERGAALRDFQQSTRLGDGGEGLQNIALLALQEGRLDEALKAIEAAKARGMKSAALFYNEGLSRSMMGQLEPAVVSFTNALTADGIRAIEAPVRAKRALALIDLRRLPEAQTDAEQAIALSPTDADVLQAAAFVALAQKDFEASIKRFDQQLQARADALGYYGRARAHAGLRSFDRALADIDAALAIDVGNPALTQFRAMISAQKSGATKP